jgi:hypothetical protein
MSAPARPPVGGAPSLEEDVAKRQEGRPVSAPCCRTPETHSASWTSGCETGLGPVQARAPSSPLALILACALSACASGPTPPAWEAEAQQAMHDAQAAWLEGDSAGEARQVARARAEIARTGRPALMARAELMRCAAHVASLDIGPCTGYDALEADAAPPERAYAAYLAGRAGPEQVALLPASQRAIASAAAQPEAALAALRAQTDPLARLVGAAVLFQASQASPAAIELAVETASQQGWRRPLAAWLDVQLARAKKAGDAVEAGRLKRRIDLVLGDGVKPSP